MRCTSCGADLSEGTTFCTSCGAKVVPVPTAQSYSSYDQNTTGYQQPVNTYTGYNQPYQQPMQQYQPMNMNMEDTTPITPLGYIGYNILFAIPIVGLVMMFVYGFGSNTNRNVKNYARSYLIMMLIVVIIYVVVFLIFGAVIAGMANS